MKMLIIKKVNTSHILIFLGYFFYASSAFSFEYTGWKVKGTTGNSKLEFVMAIDYSFKDIELDLTKKGFPKRIANESYLLLLKEYMTLGRENKPDKMIPMFSTADGSQKQFQKEIKEIPDKYARFNLAEKVVIDEIVKWGNYRAVNIRVFGKQGLLTPYTELFYCTSDSCKLSNRLYRLDKNFSFFAAIMVLVPSSSKVEFKKDNFFPVYHDDSDVFPIYLKIKANHYPKIISIKKGVEKKQAVQKEPNDVLESLKNIEFFVKDLWEKEILPLPNDNDAERNAIYLKNIQIIGSVYNKYWNGNQNQNLISNYQLKESQTSEKTKAVNTSKSNISEHTSVNYTNFSLAQLIFGWKAYHPLAYLDTKDRIFHWVEYEKENDTKGILLFSYDKKKQKLTLVTKSRTGRLLVNGLIAEQLSNLIGVSTGN